MKIPRQEELFSRHNKFFVSLSYCVWFRCWCILNTSFFWWILCRLHCVFLYITSAWTHCLIKKNNFHFILSSLILNIASSCGRFYLNDMMHRHTSCNYDQNSKPKWQATFAHSMLTAIPSKAIMTGSSYAHQNW